LPQFRMSAASSSTSDTDETTSPLLHQNTHGWWLDDCRKWWTSSRRRRKRHGWIVLSLESGPAGYSVTHPSPANQSQSQVSCLFWPRPSLTLSFPDPHPYSPLRVCRICRPPTKPRLYDTRPQLLSNPTSAHTTSSTDQYTLYLKWPAPSRQARLLVYLFFFCC
jgi:hypothetical protein